MGQTAEDSLGQEEPCPACSLNPAAQRVPHQVPGVQEPAGRVQAGRAHEGGHALTRLKPPARAPACSAVDPPGDKGSRSLPSGQLKIRCSLPASPGQSEPVSPAPCRWQVLDRSGRCPLARPSPSAWRRAAVAACRGYF